MVKFNCLAKTLDNALEIDKATNGNTYIGMLSKAYPTIEAAEKEMNIWSKALNGNISIGLGAGDPKQCYVVTELASRVNANHANQVFTEVPATRRTAKNKDISINSLISPSGKPGQVIISTGPESSTMKTKALVDVFVAAQMIKEMGGTAIKFFNMSNMKSDAEYVEVAKACAKYDLILEPTGGLGLNNIEKYLNLAKENGVKNIMPHVYSSIIDKKTGLTKIEDVKFIWSLLERY